MHRIALLIIVLCAGLAAPARPAAAQGNCYQDIAVPKWPQLLSFNIPDNWTVEILEPGSGDPSEFIVRYNDRLPAFETDQLNFMFPGQVRSFLGEGTTNLYWWFSWTGVEGPGSDVIGLTMRVCAPDEPTPTPTPSPTPGTRPDICHPTGTVLFFGTYTVLGTNNGSVGAIKQSVNVAGYNGIWVGLSQPALTNYYRNYFSAPGTSGRLWSGGDFGASANYGARTPWPAGSNSQNLVLSIDQQTYEFYWYVNTIVYSGEGSFPAQVPSEPQLVCIVGDGTPPTPTATVTGTNLPPTITRTPLPTLTPTFAGQECQTYVLDDFDSRITVFRPGNGYFVRVTGGTGLVTDSGNGTQYVIPEGSAGLNIPTTNAIELSLLAEAGAAGATFVVCRGAGASITTATATATITPTATNPALPCPISDLVSVPVAPGSASVTLSAGQRFVVADATVYINVGAQARPVPPGSYTWDQEPGSFEVYSLTVVARLWVCVVNTPTPTGTAGPTETVLPIGIGDGAPPACVAFVTPTPTIAYTLPDLAIVVPTLRPLSSPTPTLIISVTVTAAISTTAIAAFFATIEAGVSTPAAAIETASAGYSWQTGAQLAATSAVVADPALSWLSVLNPQSTAWTAAGGPLWALAPLILPVLPIIGFFLVIVFIRFLLWLVGWVLKLIDLVIKLIELIPGM